MEIASTSRALHLIRTEQRFKIKRVGCKLTDFSDVSSLPINPKSDISSRSCRNRKEEERYDVMPAPRKRNKLCEEEEEEEAPNKRQKKTIEQDATTKAKSVVKSLSVSLHETASRSKITKPEKPITALRLGETKTNSKVPQKSVTLSRIRLHHETKAKPEVISNEEIENQSCSLRDLIAKAKNKVQEKRQLDGRREYIARQRLAARLAINQVVPTVAADDHLKYHRELEQLGCGFIHDQVSCLTKFSFLSRSGYIAESTTSVLEETELLRSDGERKDGSAESTNQGNSNNCQSSTIERIQ